jgi:hypothetical protein
MQHDDVSRGRRRNLVALLGLAAGAALWLLSVSDDPRAPLAEPRPPEAEVGQLPQPPSDPLEGSRVDVAPAGPHEVAPEPSKPTLFGVVEDPSGRRLPDVVVGLWPASTFPSPDDLCGESPASYVRRTRTDAEGRFRVEIEDPAQPWEVAAAGAGRLSRPGASGTADSELRVVVYPLYGVRLVFQDAQGGALLSSLKVKVGTLPLVAQSPKGATKVRTDWPSLWLLGLDEPAGWLQAGNPPDPALLYLGRAAEDAAQDADVLGPVQIQKDVFGYAALREPISLPRVERRIPTKVVTLDRACDEWCHVEVKVSAGCAEGRPRTQTLVPAVGRLKSRTTGLEASFAIDSLHVDTFEVGGVPQDLYDWSWETTDHFHETQGGELGVMDLRVPSFVLWLDASGLGCLEYSVQRSGDAPYDGYLSTIVEKLVQSADAPADLGGEVEQTSVVSFFHAPYLHQGLEPGTYRIRIQAPAVVSGCEPIVVSVEPGQRTLSEFR